MKLLFVLCLVSIQAFAQSELRGARVWYNDSRSVYIEHSSASGVYVHESYCPQNSRPDSGRPNYPQQCRRNEEGPLLANPKIHTERFTLEADSYRTFDLRLSQYYRVNKIQVRVLRGQVKIDSAVVTDNNNISKNLTISTRDFLCEFSGETMLVSSSQLQSLRLSLKAQRRQNAEIEVNIQYSNATCGGCNVHGCWLTGGGCNVHGCFEAGNGCSVHGCWVAGGGCNVHGCWAPGGSCSVHGCQKPAHKDAGRADKHPVCE